VWPRTTSPACPFRSSRSRLVLAAGPITNRRSRHRSNPPQLEFYHAGPQKRRVVRMGRAGISADGALAVDLSESFCRLPGKGPGPGCKNFEGHGNVPSLREDFRDLPLTLKGLNGLIDRAEAHLLRWVPHRSGTRLRKFAGQRCLSVRQKKNSSGPLLGRLNPSAKTARRPRHS